MKRVGNLWPQLVSFENLLAASKRAAAGKRMRPDVAAFQMNLESELFQLQRELVSGSYQPGPYRTFPIRDPKPRMILAAPFRDRVVHHALTQLLEPIWERRFSRDSYACRTGLGTHKALEAARRAAVKHSHVLKCVIRKYFASMDHEILMQKLERVIKCRPTLDLARRVVAGSNEQEEHIVYFAGDDLFSPYERRRGLPLGNQTSQFFAKVYLDPLDQFVNRVLRAKAYVRYVDDFLLFEDSASRLAELRHSLTDFLGSLRLNMHPGKCQVRPVREGVTFLGWRVFPGYARLVRSNVVRFRRRMRAQREEYQGGRIPWQKIRESVRAWIAHAAHGETWRLLEAVLDGLAFGPKGRV